MICNRVSFPGLCCLLDRSSPMARLLARAGSRHQNTTAVRRTLTELRRRRTVHSRACRSRHESELRGRAREVVVASTVHATGARDIDATRSRARVRLRRSAIPQSRAGAAAPDTGSAKHHVTH